jgi:catechol 2,3-dioxygenase-like lactoylglutathione lyase family enzyme
MASPQRLQHLDAIDHVAVPVREVAPVVDWYRKTFQCEVGYQDETWALLKFANMSLALVVPEQHPPHIGLVSEEADKFGQLKLHRDGTRSTYVSDPAGNSVEILAADSMPGYTRSS